MGEKTNKSIGIFDYLAFACVAMAGILPQYLLSSFASAYYTDVALVSAGAVGTITLVMRFTDGVSDLIMGRIIDKTRSKWGKCRPWIALGTLGLALTSFAIFHAPGGWSEGMKLAWFAVSYFLVMTVFATMQGVSGTTMMLYLTDVPHERTKLGAFNMFGTYVGGIIATTLTTVLLGAWGYKQSGYDKTILLYAALIILAGVFSVTKLREKHGLSPENDKPPKTNVKALISAMVKNRYYLFCVIAGLLINLINGITTGMGIYFCRDIFGNAELYAALTIITLAPTLIGLPFAVMLAKKLGNYCTLAYGRAAYMVFLVVGGIGILTSNSLIYMIGQGLCGLSGATFAACFSATLANTVDYGEYKYRTNASGTLMSATTFSNKVGLGLGSAVTGLILEIAKYDGALANAGLPQSAYTVSAERWGMIIVPFILNLIVTVLLFCCNIDKEMPAVEAAKRETDQ